MVHQVHRFVNIFVDQVRQHQSQGREAGATGRETWAKGSIHPNPIMVHQVNKFASILVVKVGPTQN